MAKKVVLAGACRTAIGTMGGTLSTTPAAELGAIVIKEALNRAGVKPEDVDQVYMGCVIQAGQGQNVARQASIKAGLPIEVPKNYFPGDDDTREPVVKWRSSANLLYSNWLNYFVYQSTPYNIEEIH